MKHRSTLDVETKSPERVKQEAISGALSIPGTRVITATETEIAEKPVKIRLLLSRYSDCEIRVLRAWMESETGTNDFREEVEEAKQEDGSHSEHRFLTISTAGFERAFEVPTVEGEVTDVK